MPAAVYVQTNDAANNEVLAFGRRRTARLPRSGASPPAGAEPASRTFPSQSSIVAHRRRPAAARRQRRQRRAVPVRGRGRRPAPRRPRRLRRRHADERRGQRRCSSTCSTTARPNIAGFRIDDGRLVALEGSTRPLSADDADPAQVSFSRRRPHARRDRARHRQHQHLRDRRARLRGRPDDDQVLRKDALRLRLHARRRADRHRGVRRRGRRGGGLVLLRSPVPASSRPSAARSATRAARSAGPP